MPSCCCRLETRAKTNLREAKSRLQSRSKILNGEKLRVKKWEKKKKENNTIVAPLPAKNILY